MAEDIADIYGSGNFVKTTDVREGDKLQCKIKAVRVDKIGDKTKLLLDLESGKTFVPNKTNAVRLSEYYGSNYTQWAGKEFSLVRSYTTYQGNEVACLRVVKKVE